MVSRPGPTKRIAGVAIGIPARDEAGTIVACLRSVTAAAAVCSLPVSIVVAADGCVDDTAALATLTMSNLPESVVGTVIRVDRSTAGGARDAACRTALERLAVPVGDAWVATTDADSTVTTDWLARQLTWAESGADGVAGLVRVDRSAPRWLRRRARQAQHLLGAGLGHPHVYGANLGVRADRWLGAGGFPPISVGEDHALWRTLRAGGAELVAVDDVTVHTSGRLVGRAPDGFAAVLARLDEAHRGIAG
jgi:glycosyltransferase involved in cell wall biosynthesis